MGSVSSDENVFSQTLQMTWHHPAEPLAGLHEARVSRMVVYCNLAVRASVS